MRRAGNSLLVVDDEDTVRRVLQRILTGAGYEATTAANGREALEIITQRDVSAVLLDIMMPGMSGIEVLRQLAANRPDVCVVMLTAVTDTKTAVESLKIGASDYIVKPFNRDEVILSIGRALEKKRLLLENKKYQQHLEEKVKEQSKTISASFLNTMTSLSYALESKDKYTSGHSQRVADISVSIAMALGLSQQRTEKIKQAALVHDIGKIGVSEAVLNKTSRLTREELQHIQKHPEIGEHILSPVAGDGDFLKLIRNHHERYDGAGYPDGIRADQIPLGARILAVADAYDAMTSVRPYRNAMCHEAVCTEMENGRGTQFDPQVVDAFFNSRNGSGTVLDISDSNIECLKI